MGQLTLAAFGGSGQTTIQALATDAAGNVYVTGSTSAPDFPVKNAAQPLFGDSRILRTTDLGKTWDRVGSPPEDVAAMASDPSTPQVLFAVGAHGVYKSSDGGATWHMVYGYASVGVAGGSVAIDPGNHLRVAAVTPAGSLVRSLDSGETWSAAGSVCNLPGCGSQLFADPNGSGALLVKTLSLQLSRDWGATLQPIGPPAPGSISAASFDPSHPGWIYADKGGGTAGTLWLSTDWGATWIAKGNPSGFSAIQYLVVDPSNPNVVLAETPTGLYLSTDGAATFALPAGSGSAFTIEGTDPFAIPAAGCAPAGAVFAVGSGTGSFTVDFSPDYGTTWQPPQLSHVGSVVAGAGCAIYATRTITSDAFVAKLTPSGSVAWATYLGGADQDTPAGLTLDGQGNLYVTGSTSSPDFPMTAPRIGVTGQSAVFAAKYSNDGRLVSSQLISGEARDGAVGISVDSAQNVYVAGTTDSQKFPVTAGALVSAVSAGNYTGFLAKFAPDGSLAYASYLGPSYVYPGALLVDANNKVIIAGTGVLPGTMAPSQSQTPEWVMRLDASGTQVLASTYISNNTGGINGPTSLAEDAAGNLFVFGATDWSSFVTTPGAYVSPAPIARCNYLYGPGGSAFVLKLAAADWSPIYSSMMRAPCGMNTGQIAVDATGAVTVAMSGGTGMPLHHPLVGGPACSQTTSAVAKLSPDGSALQFATYLDDCGTPGLALAPDGSIYAGVSLSSYQGPAGVLRLNPASLPAVSIDGIVNAFSGDGSAVVEGGLYTLAISGFQAMPVDLGLNANQTLPSTRSGVQVTFDGAPTPIQQIDRSQMIVVAPRPATRNPKAGLVAVQLTANGVASNVVWMPITAIAAGLMEVNFPNLVAPDSSGLVDAFARNADGSVNSASNPATAGSTITLYVTGMGATNPSTVPGSIATSFAIPVRGLWSPWDRTSTTFNPPPDPMTTMPGFVSALFQIQLKAPPEQNIYGINVGNGVQRVPVNLVYNIYTSPSAPPASNVVAVYLK